MPENEESMDIAAKWDALEARVDAWGSRATPEVQKHDTGWSKAASQVALEIANGKLTLNEALSKAWRAGALREGTDPYEVKK